MTTIQRVSDLRQQVYDDLRQRILTGGFPPDMKFQEIALSETLGVSRTPVREALAMLVRDGLLEQARRGFRFPQRSCGDVIDSFQVRMRLEPYAMRHLVEHCPDAERQALAGRIRAVLAAHGADDSYVGAHAALRAEILGHVDNRVLVAAILQFEDFALLMRHATLRDPAGRQASVAGTLRLAEAIEAGDTDAAEAAQVRLLEEARDAYLDHLARQQAATG